MVLIGGQDGRQPGSRSGADGPGADLGMTDAEVAAAIQLVAVVLTERTALQEILDQLLVGAEAGAGDRQTRAYFQDLADAVEAILTAAARVGVPGVPRVADQPPTPVG